MSTLLIKNARYIVSCDDTDRLYERSNLFIRDNAIEYIGPELRQADQVIDASGLAVSPGLVDMHVHLRDPGLTYKEDIITGSNAAARGGITAMACMANTSPTVDCPEQVQYVLDRANQGSGVQIFPIAALSKGLRGEEPTDADALKKAGAIALSDDGNNVDSATRIRSGIVDSLRTFISMDMTCYYHIHMSSVQQRLH